MNYIHLTKLLNATVGAYKKIIFKYDYVYERFFQKNEVFLLVQDDVANNGFLVFNPKNFDFEFKNGLIDACGISIVFTSPIFEEISINVFYDLNRNSIYNSILILPKYTSKDFVGKKDIKQTAKKIRSDN